MKTFSIIGLLGVVAALAIGQEFQPRSEERARLGR